MPDATAATVEDFRVGGLTPTHVLRPESVEDARRAIREATEAGQSVVVQGGRTAIEIGNAPERYDVALDTTKLDALIAHEPEDFTATVQAGMPFDALQAMLATHGQFLPLDPARPESSTVGGVIARGRGGLRRGAFGEVRDWLIGCTVVLSDGRLVHGGGRVVKNVSGYDLPKLFAGSWGTLGCIVEASFKLRPLPQTDQTLRLPTDSFDAALRLGGEISATVPGLQAVVALDAESAAQAGLAAQSALLVRAAGMEAVVPELLAGARRLAESADASDTETKAALWQRLSDGTAPDSRSVLLRIGCPPPALTLLVAAAVTHLPGARLLAAVDGGLAWLSIESAAEGVAALRAAVAEQGGALTVESAPGDLDPWGPDAPGLPIMRRIKAELDPTRTLSPGRFVGGL